jgi:predicted transcriptional regulator
MTPMSKTTVTFRVDEARRQALDRLAEAMDRDRSYVLNEAVAAYLEAQEWQLRHIEEGLRQAEAGEFASDEEVAKALRRAGV